MSTRLLRKVAIVFGAGSAGTGWGNGKAVAVAFAREGARVICVDRGLAAAEETAQIVVEEGNEARPCAPTSPITTPWRVRSPPARRGSAASTSCTTMSACPKPEARGPRRGDLAAGDRGQCRRGLADLQGGAAGHAGQAVGAVVNISSVASRRWTGTPAFAYAAPRRR